MSEELTIQGTMLEALYVQSARSCTSSGGSFTLRGLSPSTVVFSDRPQRIAGHLTNRQFIDGWADGENSFSDDPPNAVLSLLAGEEDAPRDVVVTLLNPRLEGPDVTYDARVLDGELPESSGPCSLFIDPFGRPLSPISLCGMRRRARRRARRAAF